MPESFDLSNSDHLEKLKRLTQEVRQQIDVLHRTNQSVKLSAQFGNLLSDLSREALAAITFCLIGIIASLSILPLVKGIALAPLFGAAAGAIGVLVLPYLPKSENEKLAILENRMQRLKDLGEAELLDSAREKYKRILLIENKSPQILPPADDTPSS